MFEITNQTMFKDLILKKNMQVKSGRLREKQYEAHEPECSHVC